jgi:two-component system, sensor histidine kinase PdtaS
MTITHSKTGLLEKFNLLINNDVENSIFSTEKLLGKLKKIHQIRLIILSILICFSYRINCQSPQILPEQTRTQSIAYQTKAEWFLKLPQYNLNSSYIYFQRAVNCLKSSEVSNYQALSEANLNLYVHLNKIDISPKVDVSLKKARYFLNKVPNKTETTKLLSYNILIAEAEMSFSNGEKEKASKLMLEGFSLIQENKSPNIQARYLLTKAISIID